MALRNDNIVVQLDKLEDEVRQNLNNNDNQYLGYRRDKFTTTAGLVTTAHLENSLRDGVSCLGGRLDSHIDNLVKAARARLKAIDRVYELVKKVQRAGDRLAFCYSS